MKYKGQDLQSIDEAATKRQRTENGSVPTATAATQPQNQGNPLAITTATPTSLPRRFPAP